MINYCTVLFFGPAPLSLSLSFFICIYLYICTVNIHILYIYTHVDIETNIGKKKSCFFPSKLGPTGIGSPPANAMLVLGMRPTRDPQRCICRYIQANSMTPPVNHNIS